VFILGCGIDKFIMKLFRKKKESVDENGISDFDRTPECEITYCKENSNDENRYEEGRHLPINYEQPITFLNNNSSISQSTHSDYTNFVDDIEWTEQNSAYGAAFPCFGWIPKHIRQAIESLILVLFFVLIIYFIVRITSIITSVESYDNNDDQTGDSFYDEDGNDYNDDYY